MSENAKLTAADLNKIYMAANESAFRGTGAGSFYGQYQVVLKYTDRFGYNVLPTNTELKGLTFITRPKLNLSTSSLRQDRILATLDTKKQDTIPFMIRALLDTNLGQAGSWFSSLVKNSMLVDHRNPFITPLGNCLQSISGWPDKVMDVETTDGGFHSEDFTMARGHDRLNKSYDLTLTFRDIQGGVILGLLLYWFHWFDLATKGQVVAYPEDILERRLCYTCSIYRFTLDPSTRVISKWAKATGCFPKSVPIGACFNLNEGEQYISSAATLSVPFQVNKIEYMDPIIFNEFNRLVRRYYPDITNAGGEFGSLTKVEPVPQYNFRGLPYINTTDGTNELMFFEEPSRLVDPIDDVMDRIRDKLAAADVEEPEPEEAVAQTEEPDAFRGR